jgi:adenine phosphoribosyltransferase
MTTTTSANDAKFLSLIHDVKDFPKPGVMFKDISPLLASPTEFPRLIVTLCDLIRDKKPDAIAGVESRGFILAAAMAQELGCGFVPVRKKGKLPPPVVHHSYKLEYGEYDIEVKRGQGRIVLVDDVLATGGTLNAAANALAEAGYGVVDLAVMIDLRFLNKFEWRGMKCKSVLKFD